MMTIFCLTILKSYYIIFIANIIEWVNNVGDANGKEKN